MKLSSLFLPGLALLTVAVSADPAAIAPRPVGRLGNAHDLEIAGNDSYPADALRKALAQDLSFVLASHPSEPLDSLLPLIADRLRAGYQAGGFPGAEIDASCHRAGDEEEIRIAVTEGRRFRQGKILVSGGPGVDHGLLVGALQNPAATNGGLGFARRIRTLVATYERLRQEATAAGVPDGKQLALNYIKELGSSAETGADWRPGKPLAFQPGDGQPLRDRVLQALADQGRPQARVTTAHERREDGTADLRVRIDDPGPAAVIGTLTVEGNMANPAEEIFRAAGLAPGQPLTPRRIDDAVVALWRTGRFFPFTLDTRPRGDGSVATDVHLRVGELAGVPPLTTAPTPEQEMVMRFIDWLNQGLPGGELLIERQAAENDHWGIGISADAVVGEVTFPNGGPAASVIISKEGTSFSLRRDGRSHAARFGRFADKFGASIQLLPFGPQDQPLTLSSGLGFSSERTAPFSIDLLITPAFAFLESHRIRREKGHVIATLSNSGLSLILDGATGRPVDARMETMDCKILTAAGSVDRRGRELQAEIGKLQPARSAVSLVDAYYELMKAMSVATDAPDDDPVFDAIRRAAGLFDLVARPEVLAPLKDWLAAQQAAEQGGESFRIPPSGKNLPESEMMDLMVGFGGVWLAEEYLPEAEWLASFCRELLFLSGGKTRHTRAVMDSLLRDPSIGPVGCMACARLLDHADPGTALRFRRKGLQQANADAFRQDWKLFLNASTPLGVSLGRSLEAVAGFSPADEAEAAALLPGEMAAWLHDFLRDLRQRPPGQDEWSESIAPSMDRLWHQHLGAIVRGHLERRIPPPADPEETAATIDGVAVPRFLVKILADLHRGPLGILQLPDRDPARPWTTDPALACAVRAVLVGRHARDAGQYPAPEQIDDFLRRHFPDLEGKDDEAWLAGVGMTRAQIVTMGALFSLGTEFVRDLAGGLDASPDEQVLRDYYQAREATYATRVDADFVFVIPSDVLRPADLARCYEGMAGLGKALAGGQSAEEIQSSGALDQVSGAQVFSREDADLTTFQFTAMQAIAALPPGEATAPLRLGNGIAVLVLRASRTARPPAFEEVRDAVLEHWQAEQLQAETRKWFETREARADIQVLDAPARPPSQ